MADLFDYVLWRGDIEFSCAGFNEVDALILCQISYMNFDGLIPENFNDSISIKDLSLKFKNSVDIIERKKLGLVINPKTNELFEKIAESKRFSNVKLCGWRNKFSQKTEEQFSSFLAVFDDFVFVTFRGTDDTIVGWKEDFNLAFEKEIQSQKDALEYLNEVSDLSIFANKKILIGGHSKGGNLAVFAGANADNQNIIEEIYNFDGPGFSKEHLESEKFRNIRSKTKSYFPECSIIGMFFEHFPEYSIVKSTEKLVMQHDPMSWKVLPLTLDYAEVFDKKSQFFHHTFNSWYIALPKDERNVFIESLFDALFASNARDFSEFAENWEKTIPALLKNFLEQNSEIKKSNLKLISQFLKTAGKTFTELM